MVQQDPDDLHYMQESSVLMNVEKNQKEILSQQKGWLQECARIRICMGKKSEAIMYPERANFYAGLNLTDY